MATDVIAPSLAQKNIDDPNSYSEFALLIKKARLSAGRISAEPNMSVNLKNIGIFLNDLLSILEEIESESKERDNALGGYMHTVGNSIDMKISALARDNSISANSLGQKMEKSFQCQSDDIKDLKEEINGNINRKFDLLQSQLSLIISQGLKPF